MKLISWNVNGIRACCDKGFREAFKSLDADSSACKKQKCKKVS
jgi:exodeoxyribonuclease-3